MIHGPLGDEQQEERYLLYVAMTRAQDRLVLSRSLHKGDKAIERSLLLPQEAPWSMRQVVTARPCRPPTPGIRLQRTPISHEMIVATSIDTYEKCPRRYLYQYGYQLFDDETPFLRMHQTIRNAIAELVELAEAGILPKTSRLWSSWYGGSLLDMT